MSLPTLAQSPRDPGFVQNPYPFYARARAAGSLVYWEDYALPCAAGHAEVNALLRDRRFGREAPPGLRPEPPAHLAPFTAIEAHSMLEREPPAHTRLRRLVLHGFTSRRIAALEPEIATLAHRLIDGFAGADVDLISAFAEPLPVIVIARLLGVPEAMAPQLLTWSHAMVAMYQARRDRAVEDAAAAAATDFAAYLHELIAARRQAPRDDLLSHLIAARDADDRLSEAELISTSILLLNAGHEATVHTIGNGVKTLLGHGGWPAGAFAADMVEEIIRFDPPLHLFTRYALEEAEVFGHRFAQGDEVGLLLAAANRDPRAFDAPDAFSPGPRPRTSLSFGAGVHFCVGAPLARLELQTALPILFARHPRLALAAPPEYADRYHFHGLAELRLSL